jgi:uncharacterized membrane protein
VWATFEGLDRVMPNATIWPQLGFALVPVALVYAVVRAAPGTIWPMGTHRIPYLTLGVGPVAVGVWAWSIYAALNENGDPAPLPYLPLLNPLDVVLGLALTTAILWMLTLRREVPAGPLLPPREGTLWVAAATVFLWLNATLARTVHHTLDVPYTEALFDEPVYQTAVSIFWTVLAVATMGIAARRGTRSFWLVGAVLLGIVVVKLFVVDLSSISTVARIVSFIVVGLLLLLVGYVAPLPPRPPADAELPPSPVSSPDPPAAP